jgi:hypothetical protein
MARPRVSDEPSVVLPALRVPVSTQARLLALSVQWGCTLAEAHRRALAEGMHPPVVKARAVPTPETRALSAVCVCPRPKPRLRATGSARPAGGHDERRTHLHLHGTSMDDTVDRRHRQ